MRFASPPYHTVARVTGHLGPGVGTRAGAPETATARPVERAASVAPGTGSGLGSGGPYSLRSSPIAPSREPPPELSLQMYSMFEVRSTMCHGVAVVTDSPSATR